jgi:hypothetical protein
MVRIPMMLQDLRVHQVSEYFGYDESHGPRDLETLHISDVLAPRMMQPGSRELRSQRAMYLGSNGLRELWSHGPRDSETLHYIQ